jgi:hypothetical protein
MTGSRRIQPWWLVLTFLGGMATAMVAEELILRAQGNRLEFLAPRVHYLTGRPLARMKNAEDVAFDFRVRLAAGTRSNVVRDSATRFIISYDLWEEGDKRFKVVKLLPSRKDSPKGLTANEAEAWCVQEMALDVNGIAGNLPLWAIMEIRAEVERERPLFSRDNITDDGISLRGLIDKFSRLPQASQPHWQLEAGPLTLDQLRRGG